MPKLDSYRTCDFFLSFLSRVSGSINYTAGQRCKAKRSLCGFSSMSSFFFQGGFMELVLRRGKGAPWRTYSRGFPWL